MPIYYIAESHEAIISPDEWDAVQAEIQRRKQLGSKFSSKSPFSSKVICGDCGAFSALRFGRATQSIDKIFGGVTTVTTIVVKGIARPHTLKKIISNLGLSTRLTS